MKKNTTKRKKKLSQIAVIRHAHMSRTAAATLAEAVEGGSRMRGVEGHSREQPQQQQQRAENSRQMASWQMRAICGWKFVSLSVSVCVSGREEEGRGSRGATRHSVRCSTM